MGGAVPAQVAAEKAFAEKSDANAEVKAGVTWLLLPGRENDVDLSTDGSTLIIQTTGSDPFLVGRWQGMPSDADRMLEIEYFCSSGVRQLSSYYGPPFSEASRIDLPDLPLAEGWRKQVVDLKPRLGKPLPSSANQFRIDLGTRSDVRLRIRGVQLRPPTGQEQKTIDRGAEIRRQKIAESTRIRNYLAREFSLAPEVRVARDFVHVTLDTGRDPGRFAIVECRPADSIGSTSLGRRVSDASVSHGNGKLSWRLPRHDEGYDRLHSGWQLRDRQTDAVLSARRYADAIATDGDDHAPERARPANQKGLSGFASRGPREDLIDLGVTSVTINLVLNRFLTSSPRSNGEKIDVAGPPVYFDPAPFAHYDQLIDFARQHQIVVSAIVLIPRGGNRSTQSPLVHPESDGGVYAMPDLSTPRGAQVYAHVLDKIAQRYRNTGRSPGGISNWIVHNEIDFHPVWTNMGKQPRPIVTETYYRSMRMIHNAARNHNPHARVFASLTHHWVVADDDGWQQLSPREVLETLQRYSQMEGEFAWGVAYHPYPQSLFARVAWRDHKIDDSFDTPLITIQNLPVLGRFLDQPAMRDAEQRVRPLLLSEQGFHSRSYKPDAQADQAGSLFYAMNQVRRMPLVESFLYHRWIDHPKEGGLMLGLRTLPTPEHRYGERKRSWHVYQAIGTPAEPEVTAGLPQPGDEDETTGSR